MLNTPADFAELQKSHVNALHALSQTVLGAAEKLADLNLAAAKALLDESAEATQAFLGVKDMQEMLALNASLTQPALDKVASYHRNLYGIMSGAGAEVSKLVDSRLSEDKEKIDAMVEQAAKSAPAGAEPVISLIKSVVNASTSTYDTFTKAAQKAVQATESNFAAATDATLEAGNGAGEGGKARGKKAA
ncbi:MAG TPA: TIGR01841 family phasin [Burkholderiaceae bacterium]|nr:TIGR01841 family phasin [Burkholderiaceae bacterium]